MELDKVGSEYQTTEVVLDARWHLLAAQSEWAAAYAIAQTLVQLYPDRVSGWIHRAYAARRRPEGGLECAMDALLPAAEMFPNERLVFYNLACYLTQLDRVGEAWSWLTRACEGESGKAYRSMALKDPDLQALWSRLTPKKDS
jgi:Flp pilus assembly protein TadD